MIEISSFNQQPEAKQYQFCVSYVLCKQTEIIIVLSFIAVKNNDHIFNPDQHTITKFDLLFS